MRLALPSLSRTRTLVVAVVAAVTAAGAAALVVADRPAGAAGPAPASGVPLVVEHSGKCLNVAKASTADRAPVVQYRCVGAGNERWRAVPQDDGTYQLVAEHSGKCLNVAGGSAANSAPLIQYRCVGAPNEKWTPLDRPGRSTFTLVARHSGKCLNVARASTADGAAVVQYDCVDGARNAVWRGTTSTEDPIVTAGDTVGLQPQPGAAISLAYTDGTGRGWYGSTFPGEPSITWQPLPGEQSVTGTPALLPAGTGVQVLARTTTGDVFGVLPPGRARWTNTGGPIVSDPAEQFTFREGAGPWVLGVGKDGRIWYAPDDGVHVPFLAWRTPAVGPTGFVDVRAAVARTGVQVFALQGNGALVTSTLQFDGSFTNWTTVGLGVAPGFAVLTLPGYRYAVAARTAAGAVQVKFQHATGWPQDFTTLAGVTAAGAPGLVLPDNASGRVSLVVRATDGSLAATAVTEVGGTTFAPWTAVAAPEPSVTDPVPFEFQAEGQSPAWGFATRTGDDETMLFTASAGTPGFATATLPAPRR